MNFLKSLFGKPKSIPHEYAVEFPPAETVDELFAQFGAIGFEKQANCPVITSSNVWKFDRANGIISLGDTLRFPVQVLGTISRDSQTWLWAWADDQAGFAAHLTTQANQLRTYGETHGIELLQQACFEADLNEVHKIGCLASGMFHSSCYYIADDGTTLLLVTIPASEIEAVQIHPPCRILTTFLQLISLVDANHRATFAHYLRAKGYRVREEANRVWGQNGSNVITGEFNEQGRLTHLAS